MNHNKILELLESDARLSVQDLADILNEDKDDIQKSIKEMEDNKIICGYHTVINYNRALKNQVILAFIEVSCTPQRNKGYDQTATMIAKYHEVSNMY